MCETGGPSARLFRFGDISIPWVLRQKYGKNYNESSPYHSEISACPFFSAVSANPDQKMEPASENQREKRKYSRSCGRAKLGASDFCGKAL